MARPRSGVVACAYIIGALVFSSIALYAAEKLWSYSPVYIALRCTTSTPVFGPKTVEGSGPGFLLVEGNASTVCENLNHYDVTVHDHEIGDVHTYPDVYNLGSLSVRDTIIPAHSKKHFYSDVFLNFSLALVPKIQSRPIISVIGRIKSEGHVRLSFFGVPYEITRNNTQYCGYTMKSRTLEAGPSTCSPSLATFHAPDLESELDVPYNVHADSDFLSGESFKLYVGLGSVSLLSAVFGSLLAWKALRWPRKGDWGNGGSILFSSMPSSKSSGLVASESESESSSEDVAGKMEAAE